MLFPGVWQRLAPVVLFVLFFHRGLVRFTCSLSIGPVFCPFTKRLPAHVHCPKLSETRSQRKAVVKTLSNDTDGQCKPGHKQTWDWYGIIYIGLHFKVDWRPAYWAQLYKTPNLINSCSTKTHPTNSRVWDTLDFVNVLHLPLHLLYTHTHFIVNTLKCFYFKLNNTSTTYSSKHCVLWLLSSALLFTYVFTGKKACTELLHHAKQVTNNR